MVGGEGTSRNAFLKGEEGFLQLVLGGANLDPSPMGKSGKCGFVKRVRKTPTITSREGKFLTNLHSLPGENLKGSVVLKRGGKKSERACYVRRKGINRAFHDGQKGRACGRFFGM